MDTRSKWHDSYEQRRVIVPTTGFIEWRHKDRADKTSYLFRLPDEDVVFLAGIYQRFEDGNRFVIMTTDANPYINEIHDRMPVVLLRPDFAEWLHGDFNSLIDRRSIEMRKSLLTGEEGSKTNLGGQLSFL